MSKITLRKMAIELNTFYKTNNYCIQYSICDRKIVYIDYSTVITSAKDEYGIAPIYCIIVPSSQLRQKYKLLQLGLLQ